jgi:hypothetical protein
LQIIHAIIKQRTDDGYTLAETCSLCNTTDIPEKYSGNVSVKNWQYIKYKTNKLTTVWDAVPQKWPFMLNINNIEVFSRAPHKCSISIVLQVT